MKLNFRGFREIRKNSKIILPRKFPNIWYYVFEHLSKNLPIMLNIMLHYAKLCSINCKKSPMFSATPTYNYNLLFISIFNKL